MHNALTICMQRALQWFSAGGWEHVIALGELEDFKESLTLSYLEHQSRALGQCQTLLSCPVQFFGSSLHFWSDKIHSFALLLVQGSPAGTGGVSQHWPPQAAFFLIVPGTFQSSLTQNCSDLQVLYIFWKSVILMQKRSDLFNATINSQPVLKPLRPVIQQNHFHKSERKTRPKISAIFVNFITLEGLTLPCTTLEYSALQDSSRTKHQISHQGH